MGYVEYWKYEQDFIPKRKEQNAKLVNFLEWINLHRDEFLRRRPEFVMLRGLMEKIVTTPYRCHFNEDWRLGAIKKNGSIYLRKILTMDQVEPKSDTFMIKTSTWGYNFEKFILADEP
ncbi:unnamed protein product, partial [Allacma fusca]